MNFRKYYAAQEGYLLLLRYYLKNKTHENAWVLLNKKPPREVIELIAIDYDIPLFKGESYTRLQRRVASVVQWKESFYARYRRTNNEK